MLRVPLRQKGSCKTHNSRGEVITMFRVARPSRDPVIIAVQVAGAFHGGTEYSFHDCLCFLDLRDSCCLLLVTKISLQSAKFRPIAEGKAFQ